MRPHAPVDACAAGRSDALVPYLSNVAGRVPTAEAHKPGSDRRTDSTYAPS
jgi:hypothetical protein